MKTLTKEITVFNIVEGLENTKVISFPDKNLSIEVPTTTVNNRALDIVLKSNKVIFKIGCRDIPLEFLREEMTIFTSPEPITYPDRVLKHKVSKKVASKSPIIDESELYYIVKTNKAFSKADYYADDIVVTLKSKLIDNTSHFNAGVHYDGYNLGKREFVVNHLSRYMELGDAIENYLKEFKNKK